MKTLIIGTITVSAIAYLISVYPSKFGGLGGTFAIVQFYTLLILFANLIVARKKKVGSQEAKELDEIFAYMVAILFSLGGINLISFIEQQTKVGEVGKYLWIIIASIVSCFVIQAAYLLLTDKFFKRSDVIAQSEMKKYWELRLAVSFSISFIALVLSIISIVMFHVALEHMPYSPTFKLEWFKMANIVLFFSNVGILVSLKYFIALDPKLISQFASNKDYGLSERDLKLVRKYFLFSFAVIAVLGTGLEYSRGLWTTWFLTLALFVLMSLHFWRVFIGILPEQNSNTY